MKIKYDNSISKRRFPHPGEKCFDKEATWPVAASTINDFMPH
jgi:hypothetical protein